jgi:hypothetical protein
MEKVRVFPSASVSDELHSVTSVYRPGLKSNPEASRSERP